LKIEVGLKVPSILQNMMQASMALVVGRISRFFLATVVLKQVGASAWGEIAFALAVIQYLAFILEGGLVTLAQIKHNDNYQFDVAFLRILVWNRFIVSVLLVLVSAFLISFVSFAGSQSLVWYLAFLIIRPFALDWLFLRKGYAGFIQIIQAVRQVSILFVFLVGFNASVFTFILLDIISELLVALFLWYWFFKKTNKLGQQFLLVPLVFEDGVAILKKVFKDILNCKIRLVYPNIFFDALPLFLGSFFLLLHQNIDLFFLRIYTDLSTTGIYDYAYKIMMFAYFLGTSISAPLRRQLARHSDAFNSQRLVISSQRILLSISWGFHIVVLIVFPVFLPLFIPDTYLHIVLLLQILSLYLLIAFFSIPLSEWLITNGKPSDYVFMAIIGGGVNLLTNIWFVPLWGAVGAAISTVLAELSIFFYLSIKTSKVLQRYNIIRQIWPLGIIFPLYFTGIWLCIPKIWAIFFYTIPVMSMLLLSRYWKKSQIQLLRKF
jgi:O-antigen/teichoic acid export membrane protein